MSRQPDNRRRTWVIVATASAIGFVLAVSGALNGVWAPLTRPVGFVTSFWRGLTPDAAPMDGSAGIGAEKLLIENARLKALLAENEALKSALAYREREDAEPALLARVISATDSDVLHGLVIDRGEEDGVLPGQPVMVGDGLVVGKVFETRPHGATVMMLSDSHSRLAVTVQTDSETIGVLEGDRGLATRITLIPQTEFISIGDTVITSGLEEGIRRGLVVGVVDKVTKDNQAPFQEASVRQMRETLRPTFVQVITTIP
jgi:rod shape-determining protein MreC